MSDKSFGDQTNRNVVKNPLLSSAVVGLSIDDLTQNAVLLPAIPSQELIAGQDNKNEVQMHTLRHSDDSSALPAGDANFNQTNRYTSSNIDQDSKNIYNTKKLTLSKASAKSDDDFDVNEYFARLQCTRYVSAPINSCIKEDQNANLPTEDNLEEINLNEDKTNTDEVQQSITADIAQNFSQLPTVLPQVASAVFSSFSNMLNLKSREQTPDDRVQYNDGARNVQLGVPEEKVVPQNVVPQSLVQQTMAPPPSVAPPPLKEPPTVGTASNYRITTKKKVYAQIPGLSSGDSHVHFPPSNTAPYFAEAHAAPPHTARPAQTDHKADYVATGFDSQYSILSPPTFIDSENQKVVDEIQSTFTMNPVVTEEKSDVAKVPINYMVPTQESNVPPVAEEKETRFSQQNLIQPTQQTLMQSAQPSTAIIPPPPMFSNLSRKDSQSSVGKSVLPPSVARRISANQPIIKSQAPLSVISHENIFVPILEPDTASQNVESTFGYKSYGDQSCGESSDFTGNIGASHGTFQTIQNQNDVTTQNVPNINLPQTTTQLTGFPSSYTGVLESTDSAAVDDSKNTYSSKDLSIPPQQPMPFDAFVTPSIRQTSSSSVASNVPHFGQEHVAPPKFYNPLQTDFAPNVKQDELKNAPPIQFSQSYPQFANLPPEPPKPIQEPPKMTGNLNYRMAKKKPQYYLGPIEGVGSISNNIKPIINPVEPKSFQGALFTPDQTMTPTNTVYPDYSTRVLQEPFDINKPATIENFPSYDIQLQTPQTEFNTAFDLSRPTTEKFEEPQHEFKGFGIIGSLKSKLISLDINKIQNKVTTFFDPAYNATSNKSDKSESKQHGYQNAPGGNSNYYPQNEGTSLEVFAPNVNQEQTFGNSYSYQVDQIQQINQPQDYYNTQNQPQTYPNQNYYSGWYDNYNQQQQTQTADLLQTSTNPTQEIVESNEAVGNTLSQTVGEINIPSSIPYYLDQGKVSQTKNSEIQEQIPNVLQPEVIESSYSLFDHQKPAISKQVVLNNNDKLTSDVFKTDNYNLKSEQAQTLQATLDSSLKSFFDNPSIEFLPEANIRRKSHDSQSILKTEITQSTAQAPLKSIIGNPTSIEKPTIQSYDTIHGGYCSDFVGDNSKTTQVFIEPSSKGFFDKQTSLVLPFAIKKPDGIKITKKDERPPGIGQPKRIEPVETLPETSRIKHNIQHIHNVFCNNELNTETGQFNDNFSAIQKTEYRIPESMLPPGIITKNNSERIDNTKDIPSVKSLQETSDLNENAFSLFDSSSNVASVPFFNISSIPPGPGPLNNAQDFTELATKLENVSLFQNEPEINTQPTYNLFGSVEAVDIKEDDDNKVSDLSICETCREVNKPEEKESDDLTTQLIENITAPIQLANPVEYPIAKDETIPVGTPNYPSQLANISLIPENIIENMIIPPPINLIEDVNVTDTILNYGWSTNEPHSSNIGTDHYNFPSDSNSIGFLQDKSLFFEKIPTNACDEIKVEYRNSQEDTSLLTHQMSIPSAPPEEDTKSDESGLDVHSIEQDAKKDFPIYDDFLLEPSETDDDKIEYKEREKSSDDLTQDVDTFTNRVERFKKMEITDVHSTDFDVRRESKTFDLPTSTSPAITIASYFDTGNYAVENHYKNSITSPSSLTTFNTNTTKTMRIPPGFEDEYQRRLSGISSQDLACAISTQIATYIPDKSKKIFHQGVTNVDEENVCDLKVVSMVEKLIDDDNSFKEESLSAFSNIIEPDPGVQLRFSTIIERDPGDHSQFFNIIEPDPGAHSRSSNVIEPDPAVQSRISTVIERDPGDHSQFFNIIEPDLGAHSRSSNVIEPDPGIQPRISTVIERDPGDHSQFFNIIEPDLGAHSRSSNVIEPDRGDYSRLSNIIEPDTCVYSRFSNVIEPDPVAHSRSSNVIEPHPGAYSRFSNIIEPDPVANSRFSNVIEPDPGAYSRFSNVIEPDPVAHSRFSNVIEPDPVAHSRFSNVIEPDPVAHPRFSNMIEPERVGEILKYDCNAPKEESHSPIQNIIESEPVLEKFTHGDYSREKASHSPISNIIEPNPTYDGKGEVPGEVVRNVARDEPQPLPDPINFFSSNVETNEDSEVYSNFSRLSSYFTLPPQPDHSKSFFELSQSQNHYRHKTNEQKFDSIQNNVKNFFETTNINTLNIPNNNSTNMALIRDLTSSKNFSPNEDVVKRVNYFIVDYDINNTSERNVGAPITINKDDNLKTHTKCSNDENLNMINCNYSCDTTETVKISDNTDNKVKKCMDDNSDAKDTNNMHTIKENEIKKSLSVNFTEQNYQDDNDDKIIVIPESRPTSEYAPVKHHWFYEVDTDEKSTWRGFSVADSRALENAFNSPDLNEHTLVPTDGGRYDVNVMERIKRAVYWEDKPTDVMRCSWFYKGTTDARFVPYSESIAEKLEEEYHHGVTTGEWHRRLVLPNNELVVMHGPAVMVHFLQNSANDAFTSSPLFSFGKRVYRNPPKIKVVRDQPRQIDHLIFMVHGAGEYRNQKNRIQSMMRPRVVRRGCVESEIEDTEPSSIDHLLLLCHGVGSACDMRFRPVEQVVDDFRTTSLQLIQSHYKNSFDNGIVGRVEVLPISWHSSLHSGSTGVDKRLAAVTLESIPRLRNFTNDTILDVLFYTSPVFCQTIIDTVCSELNRIYSLFKSRNPDFKGGVSLGGHSLGSVILYDLLCHQLPKDIPHSKEKQYVTGPAGTGQPCVKYPSLDFTPDALYALGSPIAMFNCIRGIESLGQDFCLPTCRNFFNIFHPYDPIAYRIEPLINSQLRDVKPFLIPHHKGRKRMHLELKDTMARVGADIKQKLIESIKNTWSSMWKTQPPPDQQLEKVVEEEIEKEVLTPENKEENDQEKEVTPEMLGKLNDGRRVDYVLQEAPFEMINEYLFAMRSHVCYWESEDTMLVILREVYNSLGVSPDISLPQQTMTVQRNRAINDTNDMSPADCPSTSRGGP